MSTDHKARILEATDALRQIKADFYAGRNGVARDDMIAAAKRVLEARQAAEITRFGKAKTKITPATIANML